MDSIIHPIRIDFQLPVSEEKKVERVVYSYAVLGEQLCLIDTGPVGGQEAIVAGLTDLGRSAEEIDLVINTTSDKKAIAESYSIRRTALTFNIPYTTTLSGAKATALAIKAMKAGKLGVKTIQEYHDEATSTI